MTQESLNESLSRINIKSLEQLMKGYIVFVGDKIFVDDNRCFIFDTRQIATNRFRSCCRYRVRNVVNNNEDQQGFSTRYLNSREWLQFKRDANVRIVKYERQTN